MSRAVRFTKEHLLEGKVSTTIRDNQLLSPVLIKCGGISDLNSMKKIDLIDLYNLVFDLK